MTPSPNYAPPVYWHRPELSLTVFTGRLICPKDALTSCMVQCRNVRKSSTRADQFVLCTYEIAPLPVSVLVVES